jgi:hypothetical protein
MDNITKENWKMVLDTVKAHFLTKMVIF